jgi:hypothetical protein
VTAVTVALPLGEAPPGIGLGAGDGAIAGLGDGEAGAAYPNPAGSRSKSAPTVEVLSTPSMIVDLLIGGIRTTSMFCPAGGMPKRWTHIGR